MFQFLLWVRVSSVSENCSELSVHCVLFDMNTEMKYILIQQQS